MKSSNGGRRTGSSVGPAGTQLHPLAVKLRAALRGAKEEKGEILKGDAERPV